MVACLWLRVVAGWSPVALISSNLAPASSKRFFDIQATIECGFTLKSVQIVLFLLIGYQRELTYKRYDGSYSTFGQRDKEGSTWYETEKAF